MRAISIIITFAIAIFIITQAISPVFVICGIVIGVVLSHVMNFEEVKRTLVRKPWGYYIDIDREDKCVYKEMVINPLQSTSLQTHEERSEFWYIVKGSPKIKIDEKIIFAEEGTSLIVPKGRPHSITNTSKKNTIVIRELQFGKCREDDIVRIEDKYGRK